MQKIVIKRQAHTVKVLSLKRKVSIRSASKRGLPGPQGAQGPMGVSGGSYSQPFIGSTIIITHNLGYIPNLTMFDTAGDEIEGAIIERDNNHFTVQFSSSTSGIAYCS